MRQSSSATRAAPSGEGDRNSSTAFTAVAIRPAALIRGASVKPTVEEVIFLFLPFDLPFSAASRSAFIPCRGRFSIRERPMDTISLFSSRRGITSATVPSAARSTYSQTRLSASSSEVPLSRARLISRAVMSLNATPTPASDEKG